MSRCFIKFPIGGFMRTKYITSIGLFYKNVGILLGGVPDCEEIVGQLPSLSLIPQFSTLLYKNWKFYLEGCLTVFCKLLSYEWYK